MIRCLYFCLFSLFFSPLVVQAQVFAIRGNVWCQDSPLQGISILLKQGDKIITFARSSSSGEFALNSTLPITDALYLEFNHLSYERQRVAIRSNVYHYDVVLKEKTVALDEVKVGNRPFVRELGDTLVYSVRHFADSLDRSIGDVIKKMPGMEVREDGRILYNGKSISNFYIDGDNVLGNRYGVGTKAIPQEAILSVEVYRNHQKIKALKDKLNSDEVALNVVVREDARMKLIGGGTVSSNVVANHQLDANIMLFNKKVKTLNTLMMNNAGYDVQYLLTDLVNVESAMMDIYSLNSSLKSVAENNITEAYDNRSLGLSTNHHFTSKKNWKIRANAAGAFESNKESVYTYYSYLKESESQSIAENSSIRHRPVLLSSNWNLVKNVDNQYVDISLDATYRIRRIGDNLQATYYDMWNTLEQDRVLLKGTLNYIPRTEGKSVWNVKIGSNYKHSSEHLMVTSDDMLAVMLPYVSVHSVEQFFRKKLSDMSGHVDVRPMSSGRVRHYYAVDQLVRRENLQSVLFVPEADVNDSFLDFDNEISMDKFRTDILAGFSVQQKVLKASLNLPIGVQRLESRSSAQGMLLDDRLDLLFQPSLIANYSLNSYHSLKVDVARQQTFGRIEELFSGAMLTNPRTVQTRVGFIPVYSNVRALFEYHIQDPMRLFFGKVGYTYSFGQQNYLFSQSFSTEETISFDVARETNDVIRHEANLSVSKYVFALRATSSLKVNWRQRRNSMIVEGQQVGLVPTTVEIIPELNGKLGERLEWRYQGVFLRQRNKIEGVSGEDRFAQQMHNVQATCKVAKSTYITLGANYTSLQSDQDRVIFKNLRSTVAYRLAKKRLERIELIGTNLLNEQGSGFILQNMNSLMSQESRLRGRMLLVSMHFSI